MSGRVILESNEHTFAQISLNDRRSPGHLAMTQLMRSSTRSTALAALALASTMELVKDVLANAHASSRLADLLALVRLLLELALISCDTGHSIVLQYFEYARLVPRGRIRWVLMQE